MIVVPYIALDLVSVRLRRLTSLLVELGNESHCGILGGPDGYGVEFSNDVFTMRPFYWGDCDCGHEAEADAWWDKHPHAADCYQTELGQIPGRPAEAQYKALCIKHGISWNQGYGCAVHCSCGVDDQWQTWLTEHPHADTCTPFLPNFKCDEFEVRWYKYIGRDMEIKAPGWALTDANVNSVFDYCEASLRRQPK